MGFNFNSIKFLGLPQKDFTLEDIRNFLNDEERTKRIHFASTHATALKRKDEPNKTGILKLPFSDSIGAIIEKTLGDEVKLFSSQYDDGVYRIIKSEEEYQSLEKFIKEHQNLVFLRDNLDLCLALDMNFDEESHTEIGEWEFRAKYKNDADAEEKLVQACKEWLKKLPYFKDVDYICAIPNSQKDMQLPQRIVSRMDEFSFQNISDQIYWEDKKQSLKDATDTNEKLEILEEAKLKIDDNLNLNNKTVLLFDDLYMSGATMQYVAMKLKEAGASRVLGITIVKSKSNK